MARSIAPWQSRNSATPTAFYVEDNGPLAGSLFTLSNFDGSPTIAPITLGTSQTFYAPDKVVFFNLDDPALQRNLMPRIKAVRMFDYRAGNNTAAIRHGYNGVVTNAVSPADHANGFSAAFREYTFVTSQLLLDSSGLYVVNPTQNTTDQGAGLGSSWIANIQAGVATASGGANDGVTSQLTGFNAEVDFELTDGTLWGVIGNTATDQNNPANTFDVSGGIPANWTSA